MSQINATSAKVRYQHSGSFAVAHVKVNGANKGGYGMTSSHQGEYEHTIHGLKSGDNVTVHFTNHHVAHDAEVSYQH